VLFCGAARLRADTSTVTRTRAAKKVVASSPWEQAERGRDTLEAIAEASRTRADYTRAMDGYRAIYHANPGDVHAPAAVNAVAELLAEQGRLMHDAKSLQAAVGQYEFLNKQYPGSSLRAQALLVEAQIEQDDLNDPVAARQKYKLLLKQHPKSEQADEARAGLDSLEQGAGNRRQGTGSREQGTGKTAVAKGQVFGVRRGSSDAAGSSENQTSSVQGPAVSGQRPAVSGSGSLPATAQTSGTLEPTDHAINGAPASVGAPLDSAGAVVDVAAEGDTPKRSGRRAAVTGIRHWSTATYTRVAIDLGDSVTYEAARVPNPDRIYFDLHGTKLAPELVGKSFTVTDDGFLKKVRAAQYSDDVTRIVLDVNDVTEYSAFLLPNPYRLIIDIHGKKAAPAGVSIGAPQKRAEAAPTVPNTIAVKQASTAEIAAVSDLPGRVEATSKPTSKPISAVVVDAGNRDQGTGNRGDGGAAAATDLKAADPTHRDTTVAMNGAPDSGAGVPYSVAAASGAIPQDSAKKTRKSRTKSAQSSAQSSPTVADATPARAAVPTADGETSLVRALGLKIGRIVIDAGHGGHDSGTLGADGIQEKDVVLDVALRLGKLLHDRLGAEIVYTRSDDTFIPLETRTAIANKAQADLFISIHANSSPDASARGVETYYLNFTSDPTALDVAARENAVSDQSIHQLSDLVKKIALKDKIAESREFASDVEDSLYAGLERGNAGLKDRGVKKAPFVVLIGANMPSILAEISFVTNPRDAEQLQQPEYRERVAESLYRGVARYQGGLSGTRVTTERAAAGQ
jgi:N-acetylmuramoyl-L-alanine amidase